MTGINLTVVNNGNNKSASKNKEKSVYLVRQKDYSIEVTEVSNSDVFHIQ